MTLYSAIRFRMLNSVCLPGYAMPWLFKPWSYGFPSAMAK